MNETIFITGLSGSGKTTASNKFSKLGYEIIHLDEISKYYTKGREIKNEKIFYYTHKIINSDIQVGFREDNNCIINSFIKYITNMDGKYVIEGIHIFMPYIDMDYIINYDIYICDTPPLKCIKRKINRGMHKNIPLNKKILNIIKYDLEPVFIIDYIRYKRFKKVMRKRNKKLVVL